MCFFKSARQEREEYAEAEFQLYFNLGKPEQAYATAFFAPFGKKRIELLRKWYEKYPDLADQASEGVQKFLSEKYD